MAESFTDLAELQEYSKSQYVTILKLTKDLQVAKEENESLKKIIESFSINIGDSQEVSQIIASDEESICKLQLKRIQQMAMERELTLEEARKLEIYSKIIASFREQPKTIKAKAKKLSDSELLSLLDKPLTN